MSATSRSEAPAQEALPPPPPADSGDSSDTTAIPANVSPLAARPTSAGRRDGSDGDTDVGDDLAPTSRWDPVVVLHHRSSLPPRRPSVVLTPVEPGERHWWPFSLREWDEDDDEPDWWFASTAIPLLAATLGPLANVFSIAALVTYWRMCLVPSSASSDPAVCLNPDDVSLLEQLNGRHYPDPHWCYWLNVASLVVGFVGNLFLLFNFTNRVRYIIALPVTIIMWFCATAILTGILVAMDVHVPPSGPFQIYSQGYWYAVIAACMYMICAMLLMANMLGYFLGHYPQYFTLTDSQRTLILQTMMFFVWLAGGAAVFSRVETLYGDGDADWSFTNALYFADVTILTVGFGDLTPTSNVGRGLVLPFSVGGIISLGLMVSSITKFATELGSEKIIWQHIAHSRARTQGRTVTTSLELERRRLSIAAGHRPVISEPSALRPSRSPAIHFQFHKDDRDHAAARHSSAYPNITRSQTGTMDVLRRVTSFVPDPVRRRRKPRLLLLREEKDRFDAMRRIQNETSRFKQWYALCVSLTAFGILWCIGAVVFWRVEENLTYFEALYFCYVSLLTIGYGDIAPESSPGRPFFVFWSLIAVPTMTILVTDLGETVINKFKNGTVRVADFTVLPQRGVWAKLIGDSSRLMDWRRQRRARRRVAQGFPTGLDADADGLNPTLDELADDEGRSFDELARRLPAAIRRTARDVRETPRTRYSYEQWVEWTQLIRFTAKAGDDKDGNNDDGLIDWDWIGEDSPMMAKIGEPEFVLERLLESMSRYIRSMSEKTPVDLDSANTTGAALGIDLGTCKSRDTTGGNDGTSRDNKDRLSPPQTGAHDETNFTSPKWG